MKTCPNCRNEAEDQATLCPVCGTMLDVLGPVNTDNFPREISRPIHAAEIPIEKPAAHDHTNEYSKNDVAENKVLCMAVYLLDALGIIIALLMAPVSGFVRFHIRQSLKFTVLEALIFLISAFLCWTWIIPILGVIALLILIAAKLVCFVEVCLGKAVDSPIIRIFGFLNS